MKKDKKLTKLNKNGGAEIINPMHINRAIKKLYDFESLNITVNQVLGMYQTIENLQKRIKEGESG